MKLAKILAFSGVKNFRSVLRTSSLCYAPFMIIIDMLLNSSRVHLLPNIASVQVGYTLLSLVSQFLDMV